MPKIVAETRGLDQAVVHVKSLGQSAADLSDLYRVRDPRADKIRRTRSEDLRLSLKAPERNAVNDARAVTFVRTSPVFLVLPGIRVQARAVSCSLRQS